MQFRVAILSRNVTASFKCNFKLQFYIVILQCKFELQFYSWCNFELQILVCAFLKCNFGMQFYRAISGSNFVVQFQVAILLLVQF